MQFDGRAEHCGKISHLSKAPGRTENDRRYKYKKYKTDPSKYDQLFYIYAVLASTADRNNKLYSTDESLHPFASMF